MKKTVLARPNLKLFLGAAILIAIIQHLVVDGHSQASVCVQRRNNSPPGDTKAYLRSLVEESVKHPSAEIYMKISEVFEKKGDFKNALVYWRIADSLVESE